MGYQIIQQPNGMLSLWDGIEQGIVVFDADEDELVDYLTEVHRNVTRINVAATTVKVRNGEQAYYQFTISWAEAMTRMRDCKGADAVQEILDRMEPEPVPSSSLTQCSECGSKDTYDAECGNALCTSCGTLFMYCKACGHTEHPECEEVDTG